MTEVDASMSASIRQASPTTPDPEGLFLRLDGTGSAEIRALVDIERRVPLGVGAQVLQADLLLYKAESSGAYTLTVEPLDDIWDAATVTWDTAPAVRAESATASVSSGGANGDAITVDVTALVQSSVAADDATGSRWYGVRLDKSTAGEVKLHSALSNPDYRPKLQIEWSIPPIAPEDLLPNGGRSVSETQPELVATFFDPDAEDTLSAIQVQIDDSDTFTGNLLTTNQASLETNTTGWAAGANTTIARSTAQAADGVASLSLTSVASGNIQAITPTGTSGIPVTVGETYTARGEFRAAATSRTVHMGINWYTAAGASISGSDSVGVADTTSGFTVDSITATAPATAAFMSIEPWISTPAAGGEVHYVDKVAFREGSDTAFAFPLTYDSGKVAHNQPRFDLDTPPTGAVTPPTLAVATDYWWRMRVWDNHDLESPWSSEVQFMVTAKGTLTLTSPAGSTVSSPTPTITHTFSATQSQVEVEIERLVGGVWQSHWLLAKHVSSATSHTVPNSSRLAEGESYRVSVRVWDDVDREDMAGDRAFYEDSQEFILTALS